MTERDSVLVMPLGVLMRRFLLNLCLRILPSEGRPVGELGTVAAEGLHLLKRMLTDRLAMHVVGGVMMGGVMMGEVMLGVVVRTLRLIH
jgi:hypothetical protein